MSARLTVFAVFIIKQIVSFTKNQRTTTRTAEVEREWKEYRCEMAKGAAPTEGGSVIIVGDRGSF